MQPGAELIVEEYLDLVENWCVHFCVEAIGGPRLLGATEQIISATGAYGGSRVGGTVLPPAAAELCQAVAERARELGFIGYCGIDTGLTSSGELRVFDLNFRINASTPPLLVLNAIAASRGPSWEGRGRWQTYRHGGSLPELVKQLDSVYPDGALVPIASYDPAFTANGCGTLAAVGAADRRRRAGPPAADRAGAPGGRRLLGGEPGLVETAFR